MACHIECAHASRMISAAFVQQLTWHISSGHVREITLGILRICDIKPKSRTEVSDYKIPYLVSLNETGTWRIQ